MYSFKNIVGQWFALPLSAGLVLAVGCTSDTSRDPLSFVRSKKAIHGGPATPVIDAGADASGGACDGSPPGEVLTGPVVGPTNEYVELCRTGVCGAHSGFFDISQVALDYGDFPFRTPSPGSSLGNPVGEFFFAVLAPGYEDAIFDGAEGNLSDRAASAVSSDRGGGDTEGDRTIFVAPDQSPLFFPTSHGTHRISFPPSQFMAILLTPFDTTPDGHYLLAVCPTSATSRCDCYFESFFVEPAADAGAPHLDAGAGGATGAGGAASAGGAAGADNGAGAGGCGGAAGAVLGGATSTGGAAGAPCLPDAANPPSPAAHDAGKQHDAGLPQADAGADGAACTSP